MAKKLCFNIGGFPTSFLKNKDIAGLSDRIAEAIPTSLAYATQHWSEHTELMGGLGTDGVEESYIHDILQCMDDLMRMRFLYWLEALSLLEKMSVGSTSLLRAIQWTQVSKRSSTLPN